MSLLSGATFSEDRVYRYRLWRDGLGGHGTLAVIGLNPSTADEAEDDPTIRRCVGFARTWGYDHLVMLNLFAYRATDPHRLFEVRDPVGPLNDAWLRSEACRVERVLLAWGAHGLARGRGRAVAAMLAAASPYCLGRTKDGSPRHPLYVRADQPAEVWR